MSLKIISLNIEGKRHLSRVIPFLAAEAADMICLQEVFEEDLSQIKAQLYSHHLFLPTWRTGQHFNLEIKEGYSPGDKLFGIAMLSREPLTKLQSVHLDPELTQVPENAGPGTWNPGLIVAKASDFTIATTHFTWTRFGNADDRQRQHLKTMLELLSSYPELVFLGDFNAPRGEEIHTSLAQKFIDHTPKDIETTLDPKLHYANQKEPGKLQLVVDHLFTTPKINVKEIKIIDSLSDHCAILAKLDHLS